MKNFVFAFPFLGIILFATISLKSSVFADEKEEKIISRLQLLILSLLFMLVLYPMITKHFR